MLFQLFMCKRVGKWQGTDICRNAQNYQDFSVGGGLFSFFYVLSTACFLWQAVRLLGFELLCPLVGVTAVFTSQSDII